MLSWLSFAASAAITQHAPSTQLGTIGSASIYTEPVYLTCILNCQEHLQYHHCVDTIHQ